ncbi:podoplanin [Polymixia lowei]
MKVQLLLLLALVGPFCGFTRASPTDLPLISTVWPWTAAGTDAPESTMGPQVVITGAPSSAPEAVPEVLATVVYMQETDKPNTSTDPPIQPEEHGPVATDAPDMGKTVPAVTDVPEAPVDVQPENTASTDVDTHNEVVVEDNTDDGVSSGQVVGIVIGALVAVVIVIAVVIAVMKRMGKYSP